MEIKRVYEHRTHGNVGEVKLVAPDGTFTLDGKELPESSVDHLLTFALQTLQDAYAGAKDAAEAVGAFEKKRDKLINGEIGVRGSGSGVDAVTRKMVSIIRPQVKAADSAWYKNADESERFAKCVEVIGGLPDAQADSLRKHAEAELKREADAAKAAAALNITIKL